MFCPSNGDSSATMIDSSLSRPVRTGNYTNAMRYQEYTPPRSLDGFVTCFWEITDGTGSHRVLPDGAMDVVFAPSDGAARVIGPMTHAMCRMSEIDNTRTESAATFPA